MKRLIYKKLSFGLLLSFFLTSCEDFLEVEAPNHKIVSETVFDNDATAISSMTGIYNQLFNSAHFSNGGENSVTVLAGLSSDNLRGVRGGRDLLLLEFDEHRILPDNSRNLSLWSSAYNIIYMINSLLEGVENSSGISQSIHATLEGEAKFIRAFTYFYLVNLYGDVPLIITTDYRQNSLATRVEQELIYHQILLDLSEAIELLEDEYRDGDRTRVNRFAALALLARVNLYLENWEEAERLSDIVLSNTSDYELIDDLNEAFLANSKEALWQISPIGRGGGLSHTHEGNTFIFNPLFYTITKVGLTEELVETFDNDDKRLTNWIQYHAVTDNYYAYKYKIWNSMESITEQSMVLRLAEQYLIRAEARARQNNIAEALADLDVIRERAGISLLSDTGHNISQNEILRQVLEERRKELFTEWGHRWLDLKRTGMISSVLGIDELLFPIPEEELLKNPNLVQSPGY